MLYARVLVDVAGRGLERGFDYVVPEDYPCEVLPGMCVSVHFGPRVMQGLVVDVTDHTDIPAEKLKPLGLPRYDGRAVSKELTQLAAWMAKKYHCTMAEALRPVLPPGTRSDKARQKTRMRPVLSVTREAAQLFIDTCPARFSRQIALVSLLLDGADSEMLTEKLPDWRQSARALEKKGIVKVTRETRDEIPYRALGQSALSEPTLMPQQAQAVDVINEGIAAGCGTYYLFGVTGSGKTEVYLQCARYAVSLGKNAIILVPEIALTPQMVDRFRARFGEEVSVLHSGLTLAQRRDQWQRIQSGSVRVAVGARSAIFAPFETIGLIVVDEEHESSYCAESAPRYDAVEVAQKRCQMHGAALVMGSATPSLARYRAALEGKIRLLTLPGRVRGLPMPKVSIVDMREELQKGNRTMFSEELRQEMEKTLWNGEQAVLFLNRRGYSTFVSCRDCGEAVRCPNCDVALTYHSAGKKLTCRYCGYEGVPPTVCPACGSKRIKYFGAGTQRIEEELQNLFPGVRALRMDRDTTQKKDAHEKILSAFARGEAQVLLGTQMIAKGLDFPNITLVGVMSADTALHAPDYAGAERAFELVAQVAGRAGRGDKPGRVVVQTYCPDEAAIRFAAKHDYPAFYQEEIRRREEGQFPPFTRFIRFLFADADEEKCKAAAGEYADALAQAVKTAPFDNCRDCLLTIQNMEAPVARIENRSRAQVLVRLLENEQTDAFTEALMAFDDAYAARGLRPVMEINPRHMI